MEKFVIQEGSVLSGEIPVNGAKNAVMKILAGSLLSEETIRLTNVPRITEVLLMIDLLEDLGAYVEWESDRIVTINTSKVRDGKLNPVYVRKIRSSLMLVGPLLARFGKVEFPHPGGCVIGKRPIDYFLDSFRALGAEVETLADRYVISAPHGLQGTEYFFPKISHTGTESLMMTAVLSQGTTVIKNAACEPEVVALGEYLNSVGAQIEGLGTHTITITGVQAIGAGDYAVIPDRIEAATFAILGALCAEKLTVTHCNPQHLEALWNIFKQMGIKYELGEDFVTVWGRGEYDATDVTTHEYPGFATDIQSPLIVLLTQCNGSSIARETIFEGRLFFTDKLNQMGANIILCDPFRAVIYGKTPLFGRRIESPDLRAGMALLLAGLIAKGTTEVQNIGQIDRGYEAIEKRLQAIGAKIERVKE